VTGRDPQCDIVMTDARVSWHHAVLGLEDGRWVLADNGSTNGTYIGGRRVDRIEVDGSACSASAILLTGRSWAAQSVEPPGQGRPACASAGRRITIS
jgi:pSer/pThr/pTyr-binding forkhead associated (FHA) protein